jgi:hypothetical protein
LQKFLSVGMSGGDLGKADENWGSVREMARRARLRKILGHADPGAGVTEDTKNFHDCITGIEARPGREPSLGFVDRERRPDESVDARGNWLKNE